MQLHNSARISLRRRACHQKAAKVMQYHDGPEQVRLLPSAYFLRRAANSKHAKELFATPVPKALTPKQLYPTMRTHAGQLAL